MMLEEPGQLLRDYGLYCAPVDVRELACRLGIEIIQWRPKRFADLPACPRRLAGMLLRIDDWAEITINGGQPETRRRFTIAHELWHYLTGDGMVRLSMCDDQWQGSDEREANLYAARLLMPDGLMAVYQHLPFEELCRTFHVSHRAMSLRLRELAEQSQP